MEILKTSHGNNYMVVFHEFLSMFPLIFPVPDQKMERFAQLLVEQVVPLFGVPKALLSDRGTKLLSRLMTSICKLLDVTKLNNISYHPQCNRLVERFS